MGDMVHDHVMRFQTLRSDRSTWDSQWDEAAELLVPAHKASFTTQGTHRTPGQKNTEKMYDATAALALHRFASVIESLATPQAQQWHRLAPAEDSIRNNRRVKLFLDEVTRILFRHRYRPKANFVGQSQAGYVSYGAYGNGLLFTDQLGVEPGVRYRNLHLGETYLMEDHQGTVNAFYRTFMLKPAEMASMFGDDTPESVKKEVGNPAHAATRHEVLHCVYPRDVYDPGRVDGKGMPWASLYIFVKEQKLIREGGYTSFPLAVARYTQYPGEIYGRGPAQLVLPAIKVLNVEKKTILKQGHRVVDPVLLAHDDGVAGFSMRNGAMNYGSVSREGRPLVHVLPTGNLAVGQELMEDERRVINDAFLITLFQILVDGPDRMTATEVLERTREKGLLIAPTAGRLQAEFLGPLIEREIDLLGQQGLLPPIPDVLREAGGGFVVEYDAPMSRMARAENAAGFMRSLDSALNFVQITGDPAPLDWFNFDKAMPAIQDINGAPVEWTSSEEEVQAKREARAAQAQAQQTMEALPALAGGAKAVAGIAG